MSTESEPLAEEENPPCWCGVENPYYEEIFETCGGMGFVHCRCGGDVECFGCKDCEDDYVDDQETMP